MRDSESFFIVRSEKGRLQDLIRCSKGAGASLFVASLLGFYLLIVQLFDALAFPFNLPVGDLGNLWVPALKK